MKPTLQFPLFLFSVLIFCQISTAQSVLPADRVDMFIEPQGAASDFNPIENDSRADFAQDSVKITLAITLPDDYLSASLAPQQQLSKIYVKLGSSAGAGNIVQRDFVYEETAGLPAGMSYKREGQTVYLCLGIFTGMQQFHARVEMETGNGQRSAAVTTAF